MPDQEIDNASIEVVHAPERRRFELLDAGRAIGEEDYVDRDGRRVFFHTAVSEDYGGRGLASLLVRAALEATLGEGLTPVGVCPYVHAWLEKHPDFLAASAEPERADLDALRDLR